LTGMSIWRRRRRDLMVFGFMQAVTFTTNVTVCGVSYCCLTPTQQFFSYIMARTS